MRNFVWRSWTSIFFRDKSSDETTSPRETDAFRGDREVHPTERVAVVDQKARGVARHQHAVGR